MSCTDVVEVNRIDELQSYHLAWSALHAETPGATFFQTLEWLTTYWKHHGEGKRLRVLIVRSHDRPIGIVPLCEVTEAGRLGPVTVLTYPLDEWATRFGPIGPFTTATLALAYRHLSETPRTWDVFEPRWVAHRSADHGRTERAMRLAGFDPTASDDWQTSLVHCDQFDDWQGYLASRSGKTRHELRRQRRQLDRVGAVEHLHHRPEPLRSGDGDPRWDLFEHCVRVSKSSWQAISSTGNTICSAEVGPLVRDAHEQAARLGMLDLHLLTVDGQPAAYFYGYHTEGRTIGLRTGYDPAAPKGAGAVLFGRVIQRCCELGDTSIDLGIGNEAYKARFRTGVETSTRLSYVPPAAWRPRAVSFAKRCWRRLTPTA